MRWKLILAVALSIVMMPSVSIAADRVVVSRSDGNDTPGPLDLASVKARHGANETRFLITTHSAFSDKEINGDDGFFEIDIDTNADRRANFVVLVFHAAGSMRGVLIRPNGDLITRNLSGNRVSGRQVSVVVGDGKLNEPKSFDFATFSVWGGKPCSRSAPCVDAIPNRYPLLRMDYTAPTIDLDVQERLLTDLPVRLDIDVEDDRFGVGVKQWQVEVRRAGYNEQFTTLEGTRAGSFVRSVTPGGGIWTAKLTAEDKSGNVSRPAKTVIFSVPWDDTDPTAVYGGSWTALTDVEGMFGGTVHEGAQDATFSIHLKGYEDVCFLGGPTSGPDATATVAVEGYGITHTLTETSSTVPGSTVLCVSSAQERTVSLTVDSEEPIVLDGVYVTD